MNNNTKVPVVTYDEIGSLFTKIALKDQGFLILVLTAAKRAGCDLAPEDLATLAEWGREIRTLAMDSSENDGCQ